MTQRNGKVIRSCAELQKAISSGQLEYAVLLNGGVYSRKTITCTPQGRFRIENGIDGSVQTLTAMGIQDERKTNIGKAMQMGSFVAIS